MITAATVTGVRVAAIPVDDPSPQPTMTETIAYQQVANGRAALAAVTGTTDVRTRVPMVGSTVRLSNASPMALSSLIGFSTGSIFLYLLDAPVGVSTSTCVTVTLLARIILRESGPFTGFMNYEGPGVGASTFDLVVTDSTQVVQFETHVPGSGYLDGNTYLAVMSVGKSPSGMSWTSGFPPTGQIYTALPEAKTGDGWKNVDGVKAPPIYFTVAPLAAGSLVMVGWLDLRQARTFLIAPHSVQSGSAFGVKSDGTWKDLFSVAASGSVTIHFISLGAHAALLSGKRFQSLSSIGSSARSLSSSMSNLSLSSD